MQQTYVNVHEMAQGHKIVKVKAIKNRVVILPLWHKDVNLSTTAANIEYWARLGIGYFSKSDFMSMPFATINSL